jgi:hypothetical protein
MVRLEELGKLKEFNFLIRTQSRELSACSTAPQPSALPRAAQDISRTANKIYRPLAHPSSSKYLALLMLQNYWDNASI